MESKKEGSIKKKIDLLLDGNFDESDAEILHQYFTNTSAAVGVI